MSTINFMEKLLDGVEGLCMCCACSVIAKLVEVDEGFGYREDERGVVSGGRVCIRGGGVGCKVSDLGDFR